MAVMELKGTKKVASNCICATKLFIVLGERLFFHYLCEEINEQFSFQGYGHRLLTRSFGPEHLIP